ncbi:unnamed protein product, partial [Schistosoma curassoni]|uniref:Uncharacterized protein n=1 Tax=Schistosoma curassoni TaxID=6186 RepID=A0A183KXC6_9TREM
MLSMIIFEAYLLLLLPIGCHRMFLVCQKKCLTISQLVI